MTPREKYELLIKHRLEHPIEKSVYTERHHIIPRCVGGTNRKNNTIRLLPEEHYYAHQLLPFMYKKNPEHQKLLCAFNYMSHIKRYKCKTRLVSEKEYGALKREASKMLSVRVSGKNNPMYGVRLCGKENPHFGKTGVKLFGSANFMYERIGKMHPRFGKKWSEETRKKVRNALQGRHWFNNGIEQCCTKQNPGAGWVPGRLKTNKPSACKGRGRGSWWTNGAENVVQKECPGFGWKQGRTITYNVSESAKMKMSQAQKMWWNNHKRRWWTDGKSNRFQESCPGEGWQEGMSNTYNVEISCPKCGCCHIRKNGYRNGKQRFKCVSCNHTWVKI